MRSLERHASRCARGVPRGMRRELRLEILGHLGDLAAEARGRGLRPKEAQQAAIQAFGDRGRLRVDLARAARGRRTVLFSQGLRGWLMSLLVYDLKPLLLVLAAVIVLRVAFVGIYHIPTRSMEPTLVGRKPGGDRIIVDTLTYRTFRLPWLKFLRPLATEIERWDILVFWNAGAGADGAGENFIKRVGGLPGDELSVSHGDLFVGDEVATKPPNVREAMWIPLVVPEPGEPEHLRTTWETDGGRWSTEPRRLVVETDPGEVASIAYPRSLTAWYVDHEGRRHGGSMDVLDLCLSVDATWRGGEGGLWLAAGQETARCELFVPGEGSGRPAVLLVDGREAARRTDVSLPDGREVRVRLARIDGVVRAEVNGHDVFEADLGWTLAAAQGHTASPCGAELRVEGGRMALRAVRIDRDVHHERGSNYLNGDPYVVPEGTYFMLGDNSSNSQDSRVFGPFPEDTIIGRPHLVFWPPQRVRTVR